MAGSGIPVLAQDRLQAGEWFGEFITHEEEVFKTKYKVRYDEATDKIRITMINLSLSRSKLKDKLTDIKIEDDRLSFKIERKFETKDCRLKADDSGYKGRCTSDAGAADEFSTISMYPMSAAEADGDGNAESGKSEVDKNGKPGKNKKQKNADVDVREVKASSSGNDIKGKNKDKDKDGKKGKNPD